MKGEGTLLVAAILASEGATPDEADAVWRRVRHEAIPDSPGDVMRQLFDALAEVRGDR